MATNPPDILDMARDDNGVYVWTGGYIVKEPITELNTQLEQLLENLITTVRNV